MGWTGLKVSTTEGNCGGCSPPCHWTHTVRVKGQCASNLGLATIVYTKPDSSTITHTLDGATYFDTLSDPDPGTWTIKVSRPCFDDKTITVTIEQCKSQTVTVVLDLTNKTLHYSDGGGSFTATLGPIYPWDAGAPVCGWEGEYDFATIGIEHAECGPYVFSNLLINQSITVPVLVQAYLAVPPGLPWVEVSLYRKYPSGNGYDGCGGPFVMTPGQPSMHPSGDTPQWIGDVPPYGRLTTPIAVPCDTLTGDGVYPNGWVIEHAPGDTVTLSLSP